MPPGIASTDIFRTVLHVNVLDEPVSALGTWIAATAFCICNVERQLVEEAAIQISLQLLLAVLSAVLRF